MNLILADGCGNNYPVSPCPPPSTTVPPPPNTASTGGDITLALGIGLPAMLIGFAAMAAARRWARRTET